jgi:hypothetical protein
MRFRKLRIAWSVMWGIAAVLLIALWVRSYWVYDVFGEAASAADEFSIHSSGGYIGVLWGVNFRWGKDQMKWVYRSRPSDASTLRMPSPWLPKYWNETTYRVLDVPHWLTASLVAFCAVASWLPWWPDRFSLRTLLIATTLVAVVLGLIVWLR